MDGLKTLLEKALKLDQKVEEKYGIVTTKFHVPDSVLKKYIQKKKLDPKFEPYLKKWAEAYCHHKEQKLQGRKSTFKMPEYHPYENEIDLISDEETTQPPHICCVSESMVLELYELINDHRMRQKVQGYKDNVVVHSLYDREDTNDLDAGSGKYQMSHIFSNFTNTYHSPPIIPPTHYQNLSLYNHLYV